MESPIQNLSQICDGILAAEGQGIIEATSERISLATERGGREEELTGRDVREQGEGGAASAEGACEEQNSEPENEEEPQARSSARATSSELYTSTEISHSRAIINKICIA